MVWKDYKGRHLHEGDTIYDVDREYIGYFSLTSVNQLPIIKVTKQYSHKAKQEIVAPEGIEKLIAPKHSKLYWFFHNFRLSNIIKLEDYNE